MNLSISPVNYVKNNVSFGMAALNPKERALAANLLGTETVDFQRDIFLKPSPVVGKAPFTKYLQKSIPVKQPVQPENVEEVKRTIIECGTSANPKANVCFIDQLLNKGTQKYIHTIQKYQPAIHKEIIDAEKDVLDANISNPLLSKNQTLKLLEAVKSNINEQKYYTLYGIVQGSDIKANQKAYKKECKMPAGANQGPAPHINPNPAPQPVPPAAEPVQPFETGTTMQAPATDGGAVPENDDGWQEAANQTYFFGN